MKYFNIAGPCNSEKHYMINAATRLHGVEELIDREQYFVIHAARQSGYGGRSLMELKIN